MNMPLLLPARAPESIRIIPLGGCGEFGMNLTLFQIEGKNFVVDCGVMFPDPSKLGVDAIIPNVNPCFKAIGGIHAYIITHGHEDHIGALPYIVDKWPAPIYATPWTVALIKKKLARQKQKLEFPIHTVVAGDHVISGGVDIEYVHFNHSIPNACALYIKTKHHKIFHTGDFKIDETPITEKPADLKRVEQIGREGVDLLLADSTNSHRPGVCGSERLVIKPMEEICLNAKGAVIITTFASNLWRLQCVMDVCKKTGRKLALFGAGIHNSFEIGSNLKLLNVPEGVIVDEEHLDRIPREKLCVLATGSQGESRATIAKLAFGEHRYLKVLEGDCVVFSSRTIPGNEKVVQTLMSQLEKLGAVIYSGRTHPNIHVSGHANRGELATLVKLLKPKNFVPVHGTFSHLKANSGIPEEIHVHCEKVLLIENGSVIDLNINHEASITGEIPAEVELVDAESRKLMTYPQVRERLKIGEFGLVVVSGVFDMTLRKWVEEVQIKTRGLPEIEDGQDLLEEVIEDVQTQLISSVKRGITDVAALEEEMRLTCRRKYFDYLKKKPMVISQLFILKR